MVIIYYILPSPQINAQRGGVRRLDARLIIVVVQSFFFDVDGLHEIMTQHSSSSSSIRRFGIIGRTTSGVKLGSEASYGCEAKTPLKIYFQRQRHRKLRTLSEGFKVSFQPS